MNSIALQLIMFWCIAVVGQLKQCPSLLLPILYLLIRQTFRPVSQTIRRSMTPFESIVEHIRLVCSQATLHETSCTSI